MSNIKLTSYSHGAGCGCKLSPAVLQEILSGSTQTQFAELLVGNEASDDAAVYRLDDETAIVSTTDFFMPIVDDPHDFGAIAATNAISDIYAMGGTPLMAIAILGWPVDKLGPEVAREVLNGARSVCTDAGIPLAGGHSIDSPEPIFGLAVTGKVGVDQVKRNGAAKAGDVIYLTKPLGIGLVTTAQKKGIARADDLLLARESMLTLNKAGKLVSELNYVHAVTDVTGFGLAGHLIEVCESSGLSARVRMKDLPVFPFVARYLELGTSPGGTQRNWQSYGQKVHMGTQNDYRLIADPQTSGGLLITVDPEFKSQFQKTLKDEFDLDLQPIGVMTAQGEQAIFVD